MKNVSLFLVAGAAALLFAAGAHAQETDNTVDTPSAWVDADGDGINDLAPRGPHGRGGGMDRAYMESRHQLMEQLAADLTADQKAEIKTLMQTLREDGTTPEAVQTALGEKLQSFGITLPETWYQTPLEFAGGFTLTAEQRAAVASLMESSKADGKTREEVRTAMSELLTSYGVTLPDNFMIGPGQRGNGKGPALTMDQRAAVNALRTSLQAEGKTPAEVRTAIGELMTSYGIIAPNRPQGPNTPPNGIGGGPGLTEVQRTEIQSIRETMQAAGNTPAEIRAAVEVKFTEYGITIPPPRGPKGRRGR
jgi:Spy/CpxP family protein refolding chaperone